MICPPAAENPYVGPLATAPPDSAAQQLAANGHFGILGMRERMEQIGGSLEVSSSSGKGTTVGVTLPVRTA